MMGNYVVLDIGGTAVKYSYSTPKEAFCGQFSTKGDLPLEILSFIKDKPFDYIGVCAPGPFDYETGTSYMEHKLPSLYGIALDALIEKVNPHARRIFIHDGVAFALGVIALEKEKDFACVMLGTGLGYVICKNGKPQVNAQQTPLNPLWSQKYKSGIVEDYVSSTAILYKCRQCGFDFDNVKQAALKAMEGNAKLRVVFNEVGRDLGKLIEERRKQDGFNKLFVGGQISKSFYLMKDGFQKETDIAYQCVDDPEIRALEGLKYCADKEKRDICEESIL